MRALAPMIGLALTLLAAVPAPADAADRLQPVRDAVTGYVQPGFDAFAAATARLAESAAALCETPSAASHAAARPQPGNCGEMNYPKT